ncbi:MAG TPA: 4-alpha-glucanotransferase [Gaiellaceae bacterium]
MRASGVLLHPTSLPDGNLGDGARRFVDWLAAAGQSWWQMLPLGPPDENGSPYASASAFAGSPALLAEPDARVTAGEARSFRGRNAYWIEAWLDYAGGDSLADQVRFEREWSALRAYAAARGVRIFGDLPIFVAAGSADVRAHPELFMTGLVAGAPPDAFSAAGQLWGGPVYDWPFSRRESYRWWIERFRHAFGLVDLVRIDHFRGFVASWAVPEGAHDARRGRWLRGPGAAVFEAVGKELGSLALVAEDLGHITPAVIRLRDRLGIPGMVVLQFAFEGGRSNPHRLENHAERSVAYTGTHDHDTALGWWRSLDAATRARAEGVFAEAGLDVAEPSWALVELALRSPARLAIVQAQDILGLGSEARMNIPGRAGGNWAWRLEAGQLDEDLAARLRAATGRAGRVS